MTWKLEVGQFYKGKGEHWCPRLVTKIEFGHVYFTDPDMASRNTIESFRRWSAGPMTPAEKRARAADLNKIEQMQASGRGPDVGTLLVPVMQKIDSRPDTIEEAARLGAELAKWIREKLDSGADPVAIDRALLVAAAVEKKRDNEAAARGTIRESDHRPG